MSMRIACTHAHSVFVPEPRLCMSKMGKLTLVTRHGVQRPTSNVDEAPASAPNTLQTSYRLLVTGAVDNGPAQDPVGLLQ